MIHEALRRLLRMEQMKFVEAIMAIPEK